jgi:putative peptidoglycan lipid II flippase
MFREEAVSIVFQRGAFDSAAVAMTAEVLAVLPFMMVITAISSLFTQLLLAQMRARVVAFLAVMAICTKIGLNFVFVERFGLPGLALATVVASLLATIARVFTAVRYAHSRSG